MITFSIISCEFAIPSNHTLRIQQLKGQETGKFSDDEEEIFYTGDNNVKEALGWIL
jgi:hypothetical protein